MFHKAVHQIEESVFMRIVVLAIEPVNAVAAVGLVMDHLGVVACACGKKLVCR